MFEPEWPSMKATHAGHEFSEKQQPCQSRRLDAGDEFPDLPSEAVPAAQAQTMARYGGTTQ